MCVCAVHFYQLVIQSTLAFIAPYRFHHSSASTEVRNAISLFSIRHVLSIRFDSVLCECAIKTDHEPNALNSVSLYLSHRNEWPAALLTTAQCTFVRSRPYGVFDLLPMRKYLRRRPQCAPCITRAINDRKKNGENRRTLSLSLSSLPLSLPLAPSLRRCHCRAANKT